MSSPSVLLVVAATAVFAAAAPATARQVDPGPQDDRYFFLAGRSTEQAIALSRTPDGVQFTWSGPPAHTWDTALMAVRSAGAGASPWVDIALGAARIQQYLEANVVGLRWLNLSSLREHLVNGATVQIRTHGVTLEPGPAALRLFSSALDLQGTILILAPHPDDAEIAAFGLYAGRKATIVTVTSGNAGDFNYRANVSDPAEHYLLKGYLRAVDSVTVPWQGEIPPERCFNLGYFDARLAAMRQTPGEPVAEMYGPNQDVLPYRRANIGRLLPVESRTATWNHLVEDLTSVFRTVRPQIVVMPHPSLDTHLDHQYTAVAAVEALEKWDGRPTFLLYTNHAAENRYPFGPAGTVTSLPPWNASDIVVERIYSHPVSPVLQRRKLFALESMHDLRLSPEEQETCDVPGLERRPDYPRVPEVDYLRRGPRSEEVFFVHSRDGVREVIHRFLVATAAAGAP